MITNSLAPFYLMYYRNSIPVSEIKKTIRLYLFYQVGGNQKILNFINRYLPFIAWFLLLRYWGIYKLFSNRKYFSMSYYFDDEDDEIMD